MFKQGGVVYVDSAEELPKVGKIGTKYCVINVDENGDSTYDEYIWVGKENTSTEFYGYQHVGSSETDNSSRSVIHLNDVKVDEILDSLNKIHNKVYDKHAPETNCLKDLKDIIELSEYMDVEDFLAKHDAIFRQVMSFLNRYEFKLTEGELLIVYYALFLLRIKLRVVKKDGFLR